MTGHAWEIFAGTALLVIGAIVTAVIQTLFRRAEKTGERLGRLEKAADFERGRRVGRAEAKREEAKRKDVR